MDILARPERQRTIVSDELAEIVDKYGDERRTEIIAADGDLSNEDLIPDSDVVVTITRGGYAKRTNTELYRVQKRGGKGVRGAALRTDDEVDHLFATTNHHWILFFTNKGRVYRAKVWQLPEAGRDAKGGHVAGLLSFLPDEEIAQVLAIRDYSGGAVPAAGHQARPGQEDRAAARTTRRGRPAIIAVNFRDDDDELIGAELCAATDEVLLISKKGQSIRFPADDERAAADGPGDLRGDRDEVPPRRRAAVDVGDRGRIDGGRAVSCSPSPTADSPSGPTSSEYRQQGRGGLGIKAMKLNEDRGSLVGGLVVTDNDEVIAIKASGQITRSAVSEVPVKGRDTMGVKFVGVGDSDSVVVIALNPETTAEAAVLAEEAPSDPAEESGTESISEPVGVEPVDEEVREDDSE